MADTLVTTAVETPASPATSPPATATPAPLSSAPPPPPDWRASFPEDLRNHKSLEKFKGMEDVARGYVELEKYRGRSVAFPDENSRPEDRDAFNAKVDAWRGVPDSPEKYTIAGPEGMPLDPGLVTTWQQVFHRGRFTPDQVALIQDAYFGSALGNPEVAAESMRTTAETTLKAEWGGGYAHKLRMAGEGLRLADAKTPGLAEFMETSRLGNHPIFIKHFASEAQRRAEHGDLPIDSRSGDPMGPEGAQQQIAAIRADLTHPYHKGNKEAVAEMKRLYEAAFPG